MISSQKKVPKASIAHDEEGLGLPWLESAFVASGLVLFFQLFPGVWWGLLAIVDVRGWTWRSYSVASVVAIAVLVAAKTWQDNRWNNR